MIGLVIGLGLLIIFFAVIMVQPGPKQPKPGEDFDERGLYDAAVDKIQDNVSFDFKKFLKRKR